MKVGGEARPDRIEPRHWLRFAESVDIRPVFLQQVGSELCERVAAGVPEVALVVGAGEVVGRIADGVVGRAQRLRADLERVV